MEREALQVGACTCLKLEPPFLLSDIGCLDPIACTNFLNGFREIIANCALGKNKRCCVLSHTCSVSSGSQNGAFSRRQGIAASTQRCQCAFRVKDWLSTHHLSDGSHHLRGLGIFEQKAGDSALHRLSDVSWAIKCGQNQHMTCWQLGVQGGGGYQAVAPRH